MRTSAESSAKSGRYMAGLDGLRALAVLAVIAYHLDLGFAPGGLLGVGVFFVLSGYLITDILVNQWNLNGRIFLKDFWLRRARRLLPGFFFMIVMVAAWCTLAYHDRLPALRTDALAAVLYVSNWWFIYHDVSYFESFGPPSPLGHLWSLAVEEQFYLVWPLLLAFGLRVLRRRGRLAGLILAGAGLSALAMAGLFEPGTDPSRVYYGTDTRAFALLIGAGLALVWPSNRQHPATLSRRASLSLDLAGAAGLLVIAGMVVGTDQYGEFLYRGGLVLLSLATAVVVAVLAHPASRLGKLLGCKPLRWLGVRSYGIYLWHFPIIALTSPVVQTGGVDGVRSLLQLVATIGIAAISWRFVEAPIRYGSRTRGCLPIAAAVTALAFVVSCVGLLWLAPAAAPTYANGIGSLPAYEHEQTDNREHRRIALHDPARTPSTITSGQGVTVLGDSLMVGVAPALEKLLPGAVIDAQIGRQMHQLPDVVAKLKADGQLGDRIIIETGTNGPFTREQFLALLRSLDHAQQIVLVNARVPRPWEAEVNSTLAEAADADPRTVLIDWHAYSSGHDAYFAPDGVHLSPEGADAYAALLAKQLSAPDAP